MKKYIIILNEQAYEIEGENIALDVFDGIRQIIKNPREIYAERIAFIPENALVMEAGIPKKTVQTMCGEREIIAST